MEGASFFYVVMGSFFYSAQADSRPLRDSRPPPPPSQAREQPAGRGTDFSRAVFSERFVVDLGEIEIRIGIRFLLLVLVSDGDDAEDAIVLRDAKLLPESLFRRPAVAFAPPKLDPCGTEPEFLRLKLDERMDTMEASSTHTSDFWPSAITTMARGAVPRGVVPCFL